MRHGSVTELTIDLRIPTSVSNLVFFKVSYSSGAPRLPDHLLLKWPLEHMADAGATERSFYVTLAPSLPSPPIVKCLASSPLANGPHWLVLEDLRRSHTNPPWPRLPPRTSLESAVAVLAQIHARWWDAPALGSTIGTAHTDASLRTMVHGYATKVPGFLDALGDTISPDDGAVLERVFGSSLAPWLRLLEPGALTVAHGDAHPWNFLFPRGEPNDTYLIDWQVWHVDVGARDVAFMIALHMDPTTRREIELPLLRNYHGRLEARGVTRYAFEDLWMDYRRCVVRNLTFPILLWSRGLPAEAWFHRLRCALAAYRDLDCGELL
jgi:aminoglycoside phosphotransferase (APT) family kinase protein